MHGSLRGSSVHGICQARILAWGAIPSPGGLLDQGLNLGLLHRLHFVAQGQASWAPLPLCHLRVTLAGHQMEPVSLHSLLCTAGLVVARASWDWRRA